MPNKRSKIKYSKNNGPERAARALTAGLAAAAFGLCCQGAVSARDASALDSRTSGAVIMYVSSPLAYVNNVQRMIDPDTGVTPVIERDRTLIPLRFASEALNSEVSWDQAARTATVKNGGNTLAFTAGSDKMTVNGAVTQMDVAARLDNGRMLIPLRFFAEAIGKQVFYDRGLIIISDTRGIYDPSSDKPALDRIISLVNNLPVVGTEDNLIKLIGQPQSGMYSYGVMDEVTAAPEAPSAAAPAPSPGANSPLNAAPGMGGAAAPDYSQTNIQVAGVDEGDIIKTDGQYIYYLRQNVISVVNAVPPDKLSLAFTVKFDDAGFNPDEIYVDGDKLAVIGRTTRSVSAAGGDAQAFYYRPVTAAIVYDISDRSDVKKLREVDAEGYYVSSRKIGSELYFLSNQDIYSLTQNGAYAQPVMRDTAVSGDYAPIGYDGIYYFPYIKQTFNRNYCSVTCLDMSGSAPAKNTTFLGAGSDIYVSRDNMYVVSNNFNYAPPMAVTPPMGVSPAPLPPAGAGASAPAAVSPVMPVPRLVVYQPSTAIYKFSLSGASSGSAAVTFLSKGSVDGTLLNRYSMDENGGYFRIATTSQGDEKNNFMQRNNIYVLNDAMQVSGQITDIAPGENIHSVRYVGSRAYMVTFQTVDPFFVIDLSDPASPKILGALKIPGYSDFLQPYDDTHIIGFGKDTLTQKDTSYYLGMKLAMFDVSDVSNPKQLFTQSIGDRGTYSDILNEPRALLFSKEKDLIAFPVNLYTAGDAEKAANPLVYGTFSYQGLYVFGVDLAHGFTLKGRVSHLTDAEMLKSGNFQGDYNKYVQRGLYIGDYLYTASQNEIMSTSLSDMSKAGSLDLPPGGGQTGAVPYVE